VVVKLFAADTSGNPTGAALKSATTDADGHYRFDNLAAGNYVVVVDVAASGSALTGYRSSTGHSADLTLAGDLIDHGLDTPVSVGDVTDGIAAVAVTMVQVAQPTGEIVGDGPGAGTHRARTATPPTTWSSISASPRPTASATASSTTTTTTSYQDSGEAARRRRADVTRSRPTWTAGDRQRWPPRPPTPTAGYRLDGLVKGTCVVVMDRQSLPGLG
jgi:hypothetical protein